MTGLVTLKEGPDIEIVKECWEIPVRAAYENCEDLNTQSREVIVIRLKNSLGDDSRNVFDIYKGPCGGRPETRSCGNPEPLEFISGVAPDCCGRITIELRGCAVPGQ